MSGLKFNLDPNRRGVTLVELLVVVTLLSILLGIAATAARTGTRGKKQREAARQVNAFIAGARTRALELGRSVGVEIVNNRPNEPQAGLTLFMVETPPPYAGDLTDSRCAISTAAVLGGVDSQGSPIGGKLSISFNAANDTMFYDDAFLVRGDVVFFGYGNQPYFVDDPGSASGTRTIVVTWQVDQPQPFPWFSGTTILSPYKVYRQPRRNNVSPLQMPTGSCIDLAFSGLGTTGQQLASNDATSVVAVEEYPKIMFSPTGGVDAFYQQGTGAIGAGGITTTAFLPTGNINLLIGRYEKVAAVREAGVSVLSAGSATGGIYSVFNSPPNDGSNIADPEAFWVSINRITGHVATSNNAMVNSPASFTSDDALIASARRFAKQAQSISGR